jgi:ornithine carbamoyltransferase
MNKHFLDLNNFSKDDIDRILSNSIEMKSKGNTLKILEGKFLSLVFEKSSTRTRVSFEVAMAQLGGRASFLSVNDLQMGRGEPIEDTSKVLSSMVDGIVLRTLEHKTQIKFAENASVPIINGLSDRSHPCQLLADLLTFREEKGSIEGKKVAWCGDFNNVCFSYAQAAELLNFELSIACPREFYPEDMKNYKNVSFTESISKAVEGSDLVSTDVWVSMGDENEADKRQKIFSHYQVNEEILDQAKPDVIFLHCLPAVRGQEISHNLLEDSRSYVWKQAGNRLHAQKGLLVELLN